MAAVILAREAVWRRGGFALNARRAAAAAGECVCILGGNGAGKTTLLKILGGLLRADSIAQFEILGAAHPAGSPHPRVLYLHQSPYFFRGTARDNVEYGLRRRGADEVRARAEAALSWAGAAHLAARDVDSLSGGEAARVALARLRALNPAVYLLDEPTAHLDAEGRAAVAALVARLMAEKTAAALIATHDPALAAIAGRRLKLEAGNLMAAD